MASRAVLTPGVSVALVLILTLAAVPAAAQPPALDRREATLTCDRDAIDPESYELATTAQAVNLQVRYGFWDRFVVNEHVRALRDINLDAGEVAERARDRDPRNLLAYGILARQSLAVGSRADVVNAWRAVLDHGGSVVWTATLYDVDTKSQFLMAFDRKALRIYRAGQFTTRIERHLGVAEFPEPDATAFYAAWAGCPDPAVEPVATIPWDDVREIRSGNWVLWFKLTHSVTVVSDRDKKASLKEIKVNLHGETGHVELFATLNPDFDPWWDDPRDRWRNVRGVGFGPYDYQMKLRNVIVQFVDPERRIKISSAGRGAGW